MSLLGYIVAYNGIHLREHGSNDPNPKYTFPTTNNIVHTQGAMYPDFSRNCVISCSAVGTEKHKSFQILVFFYQAKVIDKIG